MSPWLWVKLVHVVLGAFWFGAAVVGTFYLTAAARALGPAAAPVLKYVIGVRKFSVVMNIAAVFTLLTGLGLYDRLSGHFRNPLVHNFHGWALTLGAACGILAIIWGSTVVAPAAKQMTAITMQLTGPPTPEQAAQIGGLQQRMHKGGLVVVTFIFLALVGMALS